jgi:2-keto-3-deoxy-L-fuconate dehydrogenase
MNTPFQLDGRTALVTGAGSGIGAAIAQAFAQAGAHVYVTDANESSARETLRLIQEAKGSGEASLLDIRDEATCISALAHVTKNHPLDILVNNAGIGHVGTASQTKGEDLDRLYQVNVRGMFNLIHAALPSMLERKRGNIINMASIGGVVAVRERFAYCVTKFAVVGLTKSIALDYAKRGIRCNCICPGRVETPFVSARLKEYPDPVKAYEEMASTQALGRMAEPMEIAHAALYLASDESSFITGSDFVIDGGWTAGK